MDTRAEKWMREAASYPTARAATWRGAAARSGPRLTPDASAASAQAAPAPTPAQASAQGQAQAAAGAGGSLWTRLNDAVDGGAQGAAVMRLMQRQLLESVERLPLDEIELMATPQPQPQQ